MSEGYGNRSVCERVYYQATIIYLVYIMLKQGVVRLFQDM